MLESWWAGFAPYIPTQELLFGIALACTLAVMGILARMGRPLAAAGVSIVQFELAGTLAKAQAMMARWGETNRQQALRHTYVDFLFLLLYPFTIALGCGLAARQFPTGSWLASAGLYLAWAQLVAGLLDAVENVAMIQLLRGSQNPKLPLIARWCAIPKFAVVGLGLAYVLFGGARWALW